MTGYYVVVDGPHCGPDCGFLLGLGGCRIGDNWRPGTDHAIFVDSDGNSCVAVQEEGGVLSTS